MTETLGPLIDLHRDPTPRPWCFACRAEDCRCWAQHLGMVCDWHWGILSESDQEALREAVRRRHPRGGRVHNVIEQLVIVRMDLRSGDIPNTVEQTWNEELANYERETAESEAVPT